MLQSMLIHYPYSQQRRAIRYEISVYNHWVSKPWCIFSFPGPARAKPQGGYNSNVTIVNYLFCVWWIIGSRTAAERYILTVVWVACVLSFEGASKRPNLLFYKHEIKCAAYVLNSLNVIIIKTRYQVQSIINRLLIPNTESRKKKKFTRLSNNNLRNAFVQNIYEYCNKIAQQSPVTNKLTINS